MFKATLLSFFLLLAAGMQAQATLVGVNDNVGMSNIEKELRVKIVQVSANVLEFTFEKVEERQVENSCRQHALFQGRN